MLDAIDVLVIGGGPAGLSASLTLGRARKRVLLCDAGPRRNATAAHMHNFVTRDGTPPSEFRALARAQLAPYTSVETRDVGVTALTGARDAFTATLSTGETVRARRVLLALGMVDTMLPLDGFAERWGASIYQCPYCHAWEVRDRPFAVLATAPELVEFALVLRAWTPSVTVLTHGLAPLAPELAARLERADITVEPRAVVRLEGPGNKLDRVILADGSALPCEALFARPPQRQTSLVRALVDSHGLALTPMGHVQVDEMRRETTVPGLYAAGDLTSPMQAAIAASYAGMHAAAVINHELTVSAFNP